MSEENQFDKQFDNDPERTLITLEQLSQTIEVMTSVVNRLRQHLSEQLKAQLEEQQQAQLDEEEAQALAAAKQAEQPETKEDQKQASSKQQNDRESFVVEIRQQENDPVRKNTKTLH
ncbi:MAG: hypothetical protein GKR91_00220 [Pseudomonadales bacterium]|nr:hypothetical protein [Pseudomonadales bacterium]